MIDLTKYSEQVADGLVSVTKTDSEVATYAVATKRFDPDTGEQLADEVVGVSLKELEDKKADLEKQLVELNAFIAETKLLK